MEYFWCLRWLKQENRKQVVASVVKGDLVRLEEIPLLLHVPGLGVHARGTRLQMEVMSIDELTVEASVRLLHVLDAPTVTSGTEAEEADEGDDEIIDAADDSAEGEAEAQAEAAAADADTDNNNDDSASDAAADQHIAEPGR
jgi:exoribonuclease-2